MSYFSRIFSLILLLCLGTASAQQYSGYNQPYNPCSNLPTQIAVDTMVGILGGALIGGGKGARIGGGGALGTGYAVRSYECQNWRQQEESRRQQEEWQAREDRRREQEEARRNASQCRYHETNGVQSRECDALVYEDWRRQGRGISQLR